MAKCRVFAKYGDAAVCTSLRKPDGFCTAAHECCHKCITREYLTILTDKEKNDMAQGKDDEILVSFKSGHYKKIKGTWTGDSVWGHFIKTSGGMVHINKAEIEYIETFKALDG